VSTVPITRLAPGVSREITVRECPHCGVRIETPRAGARIFGGSGKKPAGSRRFEDHVRRCRRLP